MTDAEKKMKKYVNAVERRLNLPREVKVRVMADFTSSIQARREAGQTDADIYAELGTAQKAAADLNEQMKEFAYRKSPWRYLFAACAVYGAAELLAGLLAGALLLFYQIQAHLTPNVDFASAVGIIGGADGPTAIFVTTPGWGTYINAVLILCIGIWGYLRLSRCKRK